MMVLRDVAAYQQWRNELSSNQRVGFVPTMGCLHAGHASLIEKACQENEVAVLSIYVNPTQFDDPNDLSSYPKTIEKDLELARSLGVSAVFMPSDSQMYPNGHVFSVTSVHPVTQAAEGQARAGHFDGVLTVVMKLFHIIKPDHVYFGKKDYQQCELIRAMIADYFLPITLHACPTVREETGLAMSSRNTKLTPEDRLLADEFARVFNDAGLQSKEVIEVELKKLPIELEYVEHIGHQVLVAVRIGGVRLIDNRPVEG